MHIPEIMFDAEGQPRPERATEFLKATAKTELLSVVEQIVDQEFDRLEEHCDEFLGDVAYRRAKDFLAKVLNGDCDAGKSLFGDTGRYREYGHDAGEPWAHLIYGSLFETGAITLRRKLVEAHADLIQCERIKDLESIVDGLTRQIRSLERQLEETRQRY